MKYADMAMILAAAVQAEQVLNEPTIGDVIEQSVQLTDQYLNANQMLEESTISQPGWTSVYPNDKREWIADTLMGIFDATKVGTFNYTALLMCIYDADNTAIAFYEGSKLLVDAWKEKDSSSLFIGLMFVGMGAWGFYAEGLPVCEHVFTSDLDWSNFEKLGDLFQDKVTAMKSITDYIIKNDVEVQSEIEKTMNAFENQEFRSFGFGVGKALSDVAAYDKDLFLH